MAVASPTANGFAKQSEIGLGTDFPKLGNVSEAVVNRIKELYVFPAVVLGRWLGVSDKTAKRKINGERVLSADELGVLLRSERGFEILEAVMGDAKPAWWRIVVPLKDAADARQVQIAARRRLKKTIESALDADQHLTRTIQAAEALSDEDHTSPHLDALRSMGRVSHRTVAKTRR